MKITDELHTISEKGCIRGEQSVLRFWASLRDPRNEVDQGSEVFQGSDCHLFTETLGSRSVFPGIWITEITEPRYSSEIPSIGDSF